MSAWCGLRSVRTVACLRRSALISCHVLSLSEVSVHASISLDMSSPYLYEIDFGGYITVGMGAMCGSERSSFSRACAGCVGEGGECGSGVSVSSVHGVSSAGAAFCGLSAYVL